MTDLPSLFDVLKLLAQAGGLGAVLSFLAGAPFIKPWFDKLDSQVKWWAIFGMSVVLPLVATALVQNVPQAYFEAAEPYWRALAFGFLAWAGSQGVYQGLVRKNE